MKELIRKESENEGFDDRFVNIGSVGQITGYQCGRTVFCTKRACTEESLAVEETWEISDGSYLFLNQALKPEEAPYFLEKAAELLKSSGGNVWFGWLCNPTLPLGQWEYRLLLREKSAHGENVFSMGREFDWQRYALFLPGRSVLEFQDNRVRIQRSESGHWFRTPGYTLSGTGAPELPLTGENAGIWQMDFLIPGEPDIFERMDAGIRYYAMQDGRPCRATAALFRPEEEMRIHGRMDFTEKPENGIRFNFDESCSFEIPCDIPTIYGREVRARMIFPEEGGEQKECPGLVPARGIRWFTKEQEKTGSACEYYLTYTGKFTVRIVETDNRRDDRILCGRIGTEYIQCSEKGSFTVRFCPGYPAYLKTDSEGLDTLADTAWIAFGAQDAELNYYSAAKQTELYGLSGSDSRLLAYLELPAARLSGISPAPCLPVKRWSEQKPDEETLTRMELEGILPVRTELLLSEKNVPGSMLDQEMVAATPQGMLAGIRGDSISWLGLASNQPGTIPDSRLEGMSEWMQMQFHDSRLFLPVGDFDAAAKEMDKYIFDFKVEDWRFLVDGEHIRKDRSDGSNTAVILKYTRDKSIDELMETADFIGRRMAGDVRQIYRKALSLSYDRDGEVTDNYQNFYEITHDRDFQGILILNCPLSAGMMPDELRLLMAGLSEDALYAHHMGVHMNDISVESGRVMMKRSSYFGLVDYQGNGAILNEDGESRNYDFLTKRILLQIRNSAVAQFTAEAELMMNRLFDAEAQEMSQETGNSLILDGSYQTCGGVGQYVFALRRNTSFSLQRSMLERIEISSVQMKAKVTDAVLTGSFVLTGKLHFLRDPSCDIWAYGTDPASSGAEGGLIFSGLTVEMCMSAAGGRAQEEGEKQFSMKYETLTLTEEGSIPREDSLPACLPAHPGALLRYQISEATPRDLGFRSITCPVQQGEIKSAWYGLLYTLPLGSLGANASEKTLELTLLCAWGIPGETEKQPPVFIGIRMPGMSAEGIRMSLQGILTLDFRSVELLVYHTEEKTDYQLCFRNFTLSALGLSFPPGKNNIYLFGEDGSRLGWYAAYQEEEKDGGESESDDPGSGAGDEQSY